MLKTKFDLLPENSHVFKSASFINAGVDSGSKNMEKTVTKTAKETMNTLCTCISKHVDKVPIILLVEDVVDGLDLKLGEIVQKRKVAYRVVTDEDKAIQIRS